MFRPKVTNVYWLAPILVAVVMFAGACSGPPEEAQVKQFFRAAGLGDDQSLAGFAVVTFNPKTEGVVGALKVVSVSAPRVEPLKVKELSKTLEEAQAANSEFNTRGKAYQDSHADALKRVRAAEAATKKLSTADAAVQAEWSKLIEDRGASLKKVSDARSALAKGRSVAVVSLATPSGPLPDLGTLDGNLESKDVTLDATVKMPEGSTTQKKLLVTMQRAVLKTPQGDKAGKWIFVSVKPA